MHIVIMGCGRTGAHLANEFETRGHSVAVIDQRAEAFRRLPAHFHGRKVTGVGFDRDTLAAAGVEEAYGFAAVSSGDNSNVLAARVVRETYGVENVVARISDPARADVYQRLGITTVAPVPWTSGQILTHLLPVPDDNLITQETAGVVVTPLRWHKDWAGVTYADAEEATGARLAFVVRFGRGIIPDSDTIIQDGDTPHFALSHEAVDAAAKILGKKPSLTTPARPRKKKAAKK